MKPGKIYSTTVMAVLAVGIACYFGIYIVRSLDNPFTTTVAYEYTMNDSVEVEGMIFRNEQLLPNEDQIFDITRREGERVGTGQVVAYRYRDAATQADQTALNIVENEIEVIRRVLRGSGDILSAATQDEAILDSVIAIRASTATQRFSDLEEQAVELKSQVLERDYAYGGGLTQDVLVARFDSLRAEQKALSSSTQAGVSGIYAPRAGIYSSNVDGIETILTVDNIETMTLDNLYGAMDAPITKNGSSVGKIILGEKFYLALGVPAEVVAGTELGDNLTVCFDGEFREEVPMKVVKIGTEEGDHQLLVLMSERYVSETTLIRTTTVELIYDSETGIRVPTIAIRRQNETKENGFEVEVAGVYTVMAGKMEFHPVELLVEGEEFSVVKPVDTGRDTLRAGDVVVVYGTDLYDGKPVE